MDGAAIFGIIFRQELKTGLLTESREADQQPARFAFGECRASQESRDSAQARAVAELVSSQMPHLCFEDMLTALHGDVRQMVVALGLPRGA